MERIESMFTYSECVRKELLKYNLLGKTGNKAKPGDTRPKTAVVAAY